MPLPKWYEKSYTTTVKTAISIPDPVFDAAERVSKRLGVSRSRFYTMAIVMILKADRRRGLKEALDAVYARQNSRLDRRLAAMQGASLFAADEKW